MVSVYTILGESNTRKSSTIRALTGAGQHKEIMIAMPSGNIDVFVSISALQEAGMDPQQFINEVVSCGYKNVLVPLRIFPLTRSGQTFSSGTTYLKAFINAGWDIRQVVILGVSSMPSLWPGGAPIPNFIPNSPQSPTNKTASQIRAWWGWL